MDTLGSKIVTQRQQLAMSQKDLAEATGLPQATISRIERDIIKQPRLEVLRKLAEALNVTVDYLSGRTKEMTSSDVVSSDPRASAIFRGYKDMTEDEKAQLMRFAQFIREKRGQKKHGE
jgi:transcriptional regulator with XRE-family HTH domain